MRSVLALVASALAALAGVASTWSFADTFVPFYVGLTFLGGLQASAVHPPFVGPRRWLAKGMAAVWLLAALWAAALLAMEQLVWSGASFPPQGPEITFLGLTATTHRVLGLFGGAVLVTLSAWAPDRWLPAREPASVAGEATTS